MTRWTPELELFFCASQFDRDPEKYRDRLAAAAEDWLTTPKTPTQGLMHQLAIAAQRCAKAAPAQLPIAREGLREILQATLADRPLNRQEIFDWQQRADTGIG